MKAEDLIEYVRTLQKLEKEGREINIIMNITNTGLRNIPSDGVNNFVDLGGRVARIDVVLKDRPELEVMKEYYNDK